MNKQRYRIIFNQARGVLMAVCECAASHGKGAASPLRRIRGESGASSPCFSLHTMTLAFLLVTAGTLGLAPYAEAQIVGDPNAPQNQRPAILNAGNGTPLVNIQTPSAAGVSRNTYSQFDVQANGAILNNARSNVQTQLGGWVQGNPNLTGGAARVILNEVNSSNPSLLRGYVEVGGTRAQVVIANPAGVTCDGCGFINANRATLTTGTPIMNDGNLDGYRVERGQITIQGKGLDGTQTDYTELIARSLQINAGLWANTLKITAGAHQVNADNTLATPIAGSGPAPAFAIDVAQLGGMYAGKIMLVGNEAGVGVRNAGYIGASAGEVVISVNGLLTNSGQINSSANTRIESAGGIVNSGTLYAQGDNTLTTLGKLDNSGLMAALGNLSLSATGSSGQISSSAGASLGAGIQADGSLAGSGNLSLSATQSIAVHGRSISAGNQSLSAAGLDLSDSRIQAQNLSLSASSGDVDASRATLSASGTLQASVAQTLRHDRAQTSAAQFLLTAHSLSNVQGELIQNGIGNFSLNLSGQFDNTQGTMGSAGGLSLAAAALDNTAGQIQAAGGMAITLAGQLANQGGLLRTGSTLNIDAGSLDNSLTNGTDQGIEGRTLAIQTGAGLLNNRQGAIRADRRLAVTGSGMLDNAQGLISAGDVLSIQDSQAVPTLAVANTGGRLLAANTLTLRAGQLSGAGQILSLGDLNLGLLQNFSNAGQIQAGNNATLTLQGQLGNSGLIVAGNQMVINATAIDNQSTGEISAGTTRIAITGSLTNRGLIDGSETVIDAAVLNNFGSGRLYGDHLSIAAGALYNTNEYGSSPSIAARSRLDLGIGTLYNDNGALLFSAGDMVIGGALDSSRHATGTGGIVTNNGGSIQTLGELTIHASQINNTNADFSAIVVASGTTVNQTTYFTSLGSFTEDQIASKNDSGVWGNLLSGAGNPNPAANGTISFVLNPGAIDTGALTVYSYLSESYQPILAQIQRSAPGQILSAGNMTLNASGALINDKSRIIAGGTLGILGASLNNMGAFVSGNESHTGTSYNWGYAGHDGKSTGHHCDCDFYAFKGSAYNASLSVSLPALIGSAQQNLSPAIGSSVPGKIALASISSPGTVGSVAPVLTTPVSLTLPNNALYRQHPELGSRYLIETDPRFANYRTWLSSDYLLSALSLDPAVTQKRLGDGFYEQQLIREQIVQLIGRHLLDGYASDEAEYRALMNSGITFGQAWHLKPGLALSAAQMAQLTSDLVWLVEVTVTLPDGSPQQVLVPQVYLMPRSGDLNANGSLIAGQTVIINASGDVNNSGSLAGRDLLRLTADNIANLGGTLQADQVSLAATQNMLNRGGRISAKDRLALAAGQDITLETTTASGNGQAANGRFSQTRRDRIAGLYVSGNSGSLRALAGRNLTLNAAEVLNAGSGTTQLVAGHDLTLGTITTRDQINIGGNDRNHAQVTASSEEGTRIRTQGDLTAIAGNDIAGRAVDIQAKGDVTLAAGNDVVLTAGRNEQSVDIASYDSGKKGGGLTSKTVTRNLQIQAATSTAREGQLAGKHLTIQAGQDIALEGGKYTAQEKLTLSAGRDLTLASAESAATHLQTLLVSTKENLGPGRQSLKTTRDEITVSPDLTQLQSHEITLSAGRDMALVAPRIQADTLMATAGGQLTIAAATATHELKETSEAKSNRLNFSEVTAPLRGTNGLRNALGLPDDQTFITGARIKDKIKLSQSQGERRAVVAEINANDITLNSVGDTTLVAPRITSEQLAISVGQIGGDMVNPEAKIQLLGVKESSSTASSKNSHSFMHETVRDGGKSTETLLLPDIRLSDKTSTPSAAPLLALAAPGGIIVGATALAPTQREQAQAGKSSGGSSTPAGTAYDLKAQALTLAQQPGLAWLGELAKRDDVDWQKIELATQSWDYKRAGLTKEGAAIVVIVVTALTWGAGSGLAATGESAALSGTAEAGLTATTTTSTLGGTALSTTTATVAVDGAVTTATAYTAAGAALNAGFSTLASQAAVSLINNQGNVGKTLKDLGSKDSVKQIVASMLTAGLAQGATEALVGAKLLSPVSNPGFANRFATYTTKAMISAGVQSAVYGTPLSETAKTALINSLAQSLTSQIGDWGKSDSALVAKTIAHAVVQCAAASVQNKDCGSAALGAAVAESISPLLDKLDDRSRAAGYQQTLGSSIAGMGAMLVASLTGKDALTALSSAQMVDYFNRALHFQENNALKAAAKKLAANAIAGREVTTEQQQQLENYWFDQLESEAKAKVDAKAAIIRQNYLAQVRAANQPGYIGGAANYLVDAQLAREVVAGLAGAVLYGTDGKPIIADGAELRAFQATTAQYNDSQLLLTNNTTTLIKQFGGLDAANSAQATPSRTDNVYVAIGRIEREAELLKAFHKPSEGIETSAPETYLIGTGGLARSLVSGAVGTGKMGLGTATENIIETTLHPLHGMTPAEVVQQANTLGLKTPKDSLLLWSGFGKEGPAIAQAYALKNGGMTLEMTHGGSWINKMDLYGANSPFTSAEADLIWGKASELLVRQASGQVRSVLGQVRPSSIYLTREIPGLQFNLSVPGVDSLYLQPAHVTQIVKP